MSMNPTVVTGVGYVFDANSKKLKKIKKSFPNEYKDFLESGYTNSGGTLNMNFLSYLSNEELFDEVYANLMLTVVGEWGSEGVIVYLSESRITLYDKYNAPTDGAITLDKKFPDYFFDAFKSDFNITKKPKNIVWTYWG